MNENNRHEIRTYTETLDTGEFGDRFADYGRGYICDIISEIADSCVSIYTADLWEWAAHNYEYVEEAVNEGLVDMRDFDFAQALQCGQYVQIEQDIYEHFDSSVLLGIYSNLDFSGLTEEEALEIESIEFDNNDTLEGLIEEATRRVNSLRGIED